MKKRVVITGMGAITPLGNNVSDFWAGIKAGKNGVGEITKFDASKFKTRFACEIKNFETKKYLDKKEIKKYDLFTQYAIAATEEAIADAGIDFASWTEQQKYCVGVAWGSGYGGISTFEQQLKEFNNGDGTPRFNPYFIPKMIVDIASGVISIRNKLRGPNYCTVTACASSNTAILSAFDTIRLGRAAMMITGGSEAAVTEASIGGFSAAQALSRRNDDIFTAARPFDKDRDGFVMGEGAGALILEELDHALARGAKIYAEIVGGGMSADAYHLTGIHPKGLGAVLGIKQALKEAGIKPADINYINMHATSTSLGDLSELKAVDRLFKNVPVAVSATKSMTGHLLGAAGAIEAIISVLACKENVAPPTINTVELDENLPKNVHIVIGEKENRKINYALNNAFGFGGHVACSVFKKYEG